MALKTVSSRVMILLFSIVLSACGNGGSGSGSTGGTSGPTTTGNSVSGLSQKGSFVAGSLVTVFWLNPANGARTTSVLATAATDDQGSYSLDLPWVADSWLEVEVTGKYYNEVTGTTSEVDKTLSGIGFKPANSALVLNINAFTDIATSRIRKKTATGTSLISANAATREEIKVQFDLENTLIERLDIRDGAGSNQNDNAALLLFSGAVLNSGITDEEWEEFATNNDEEVFNKIGSAVQDDPQLLEKLTTNLNNFIAESGAGGNFIAPELTDDIIAADWVNKLPTVSLVDQTVNEKTNVTLNANQNGNQSSDVDGTIVSYLWAQSGGAISVDLTAADTNEASFVAPTRLLPEGPLDLAFTLTVTDNRGGVTTDVVTVTVNPVNTNPVATAGADQTINEQTLATLSAGGSTDADGSITTYAWKQVGDVSKRVTLANANTATASFTTPVQLLPDGNHVLTFEVTVTDNEGVTHTDTMTVTVKPVDAIPVAEAGSNQTVAEQTLITLSAAASADADGSIAMYAWKQVGDLSKGVSLTNANTATPSFTTPVQLLPNGNHVLTFEVAVTDNEGVTHTDTTTVTVMPNNAAPVASAGEDQEVVEQTENITLSAASSTDSDSDDTTLTYLWEQIGDLSKTVSLTGANTSTPSFTSPVQLVPDGNHILTFKVTVTDNEGVSRTDTTTVTVTPDNAAPVASAGEDQEVVEQTENITLSAASSTDSDSDDTTLTYLWEQIGDLSKTVSLTGANTATPSFTSPVQLAPDGNHILTFKVTVTDNEGATNTDTTTVTVTPDNAAPVASAGEDQEVVEQTENITLSAAISTDSDSDDTTLTYLWEQIGDLSKTVSLTGANTATPSFTSPVQLAPDGNHILTFKVTVTDNEGATNTDTTTVTVTPDNTNPEAKTEDDKEVNEKIGTTLSAAPSTDGDGNIIGYSWKQIGDLSKEVDLEGANTATASFTTPAQLAPNNHTLTFELTVTDNEGGTNTDTMTVTVRPVNDAPVANAGADQSALDEKRVTLSAAGSTDSDDGRILHYSWKQIDNSNASSQVKSVILEDANTETASFTSPTQLVSEGVLTLTFELTVTDNEGKSATDTVVVTVVPDNIDPIAVAEADKTVKEKRLITLSATGSTDEDGSIETYSWRQVNGSIVLIDANKSVASFTTPTQLYSPDNDRHQLIFEVTVTDNDGVENTDQVIITVIAENAPPTANAGDDQTIIENRLVTLSAVGSTDSDDGRITEYSWQQINNTDPSKAVTLTKINATDVTFTSPAQLMPDNHDLTFEVTVTDNEGAISTDTMTVTVTPENAAPTANAGTDQEGFEKTTITLNAGASTDPDSDDTTLTYLWKQIGNPIDSRMVSLTGANTVNPSFTSPTQLLSDGDGSHVLTFEVTVTDNENATSTDTMTVTVKALNARPVANAGPDQAIEEKLTVTLDASASADPDRPDGISEDNSIKTYLWEQVGADGVSTPVLFTANTAKATFTAPTRLLSEGDEALTFKVTVTDHEGVSSSDTVKVTVTAHNDLPVAEAGDSQSVRENIEVTLRAAGSTDPDGDIVKYLWEQTASTVAGLTVSLNDTSSIAPVFTTPNRQATDGLVTFTFKLTVTDNEGYTAEDTTTVTVNPNNAIPVANAGTTREESEETVVTLNGSASEDEDGSVESYAWEQTGGPTVTLSATDAIEVTFTAPTVLANEASPTLTFELKVVDNEGAESLASSIDITINPVNDLPIPVVGPDQTVDEATVVTLTSSASTDSDSPGVLTHSWTQTSGVAVTLTGENTATPTFTAPVVLATSAIENGEYVEKIMSETLIFEVTVTDSEGGSNAVIEANSNHRVAITVKSDNDSPVANAGSDVQADSETLVTLDGTASADGDGSIASYLWVQSTGGTVLTLSANDTETISFTLPRITGSSEEYAFDLTVTDNEGYRHTDSVVVTANPASVGHAYLKGPLIDGATTFTAYSSAEIAYTTTSKDHPELSSAGLISVTESATGLADDELYIMQVTLGSDIDHDQDSVRDGSPTTGAGVMRSIMTGADLKQDNWTITPLTEIAYQQASSLINSGATVAAIQEQLDNTAKKLLAADLTGDAQVNRDDLYAYVPTQDQGSLKLPSSTLAEVIANILAGESTLTASLSASKQVIATQGLYGGNAKGIAIKGNYAFIAAGGFGVIVVDIADSNDLAIKNTFDTAGFAKDIEITGNYAYVADGINGLVVINISNPESLTSVGTYALTGSSNGLSLNGDYAYVATGNSGLAAFDITNPASPSYLSKKATSSPANDVVVVGDTAYVAIGTGGLEMMSVTSRSNITSVDVLNTAGTANDVVVDGNYAYVADGEKGLQIINIASSTSLVLGEALNVPGNITGIKKSGNYIYLASGTAGIHLVDVTDPGDPTILNTVTTSGANDLALFNDIAYVADDSAGLTLVDISTLDSQPHVLSTVHKVAGDYVDSVAVLSHLAVIGVSSGATGYESYDITDPTIAPIVGTSGLLSRSVLDVDTDGTYVYAAIGESGVNIIKLIDGATTTFDTTGTANAVKVSGSYLYIADGGSGLQVLDVSDKANPTLASAFDTAGGAVDVAISGNYAYVADGLGGVQVVAINDPSSLPSTATIAVGSGIANGVYVSNNTLYVSTSKQSGNGTQGVMIYNVATPSAPVLLSTFDTPNLAYSVVVIGNYAYISNESDGIQVIDIIDKSSPAWVATIDTAGLAHDLAVAGEYIYIADQHGGLSVIKALSP